MSGVTPLGLADFAVLGALRLAGEALSVERVVVAVSGPPRGPGVSLGLEAVRRIMTRVQVRGLVENGNGDGWQLTQRGRVLWVTKGNRFTL